ncbi:MAG: murein biosynthesis integral membrane protein MurJ [Eubacteriales bacterium]|nr:murein biosynthesis integral membrane protein MurJ [Eubacteriales bacterium]
MGKHIKLTHEPASNRIVRTAAQTAVLMAILTFCSKLLGFVREMIMAYFFGASYITDAYVMAVAIPGIIFGGIAGSIAVAYMPTFSKINELEGEEKANDFTSGIIKTIAIISAVFSIFGIVFSRQIVVLFAGGFESDAADLTGTFLKITFVFLIMISISDIFEAFLQYKGVFLPQVAYGFLLNLAIIAAITVSFYTSYYYLPLGYLAGNIFRVLIMAALAKKKGFRYRKKQRIDHTVKRVISLAIPVFIGNSMAQINAFVDKTLASGLTEGSVSALNYGNLLVAMISGLTITIMTTIIYPKLAKASAVSDSERMASILQTGITLIVIIAVPCTLGSMLYSDQIVQVVYERGAFDALATSMTGSAYFYYVIGLTFSAISILFTQVFYSMDNMKTPMIFGGIGVIINITVNLILVRYMALSGLALASSIASICGMLMLLYALKKHYPKIKAVESYSNLFRIVISAVIAVGASYLLYQYVVLPLQYIIVSRTAQLFIAVCFAGAVYMLLLCLFKIKELNLIFGIIKPR